MCSANGEGRVYAQISHAQRLQVLYLKLVHQLPLNDIAKLAGIKYHTVRNILRVYKKSGRTNKQAYTITRRDRQVAVVKAQGSTDQDSSTDHETHGAKKGGERTPSGFQVNGFATTQLKFGQASEQRDFDEEEDGKRCGLCLFVREPTSPREGESFGQEVLGGPDQLLNSGFELIKKSSVGCEPSIQQEMVSSDVMNFQTSKDSTARFFCGALAFLNDSLAHGEGDDLQIIKMSARRRATFRAMMDPRQQQTKPE